MHLVLASATLRGTLRGRFLPGCAFAALGMVDGGNQWKFKKRGVRSCTSFSFSFSATG